MTGQEVFRLIADRYGSATDDFTLSVGHHAKPYPEEPTTIYNLPEFCGFMSLTMREVRAWAEGKES